MSWNENVTLTKKEYEETVLALRRAIKVISEQEQEIQRLKLEKTKFWQRKETK